MNGIMEKERVNGIKKKKKHHRTSIISKNLKKTSIISSN